MDVNPTNGEKPWITRWTTIVGAILVAPVAIALLGPAMYLIVALLTGILAVLIDISRK